MNKLEYHWHFVPQEDDNVSPDNRLTELNEAGSNGWRYVNTEDYILYGVLGKLIWFERKVSDEELEN